MHRHGKSKVKVRCKGKCKGRGKVMKCKVDFYRNILTLLCKLSIFSKFYNIKINKRIWKQNVFHIFFFVTDEITNVPENALQCA